MDKVRFLKEIRMRASFQSSIYCWRCHHSAAVVDDDDNDDNDKDDADSSDTERTDEKLDCDGTNLLSPFQLRTKRFGTFDFCY